MTGEVAERPQWTYNLVIMLGAALMSLSVIGGMSGKKDDTKKGKPEIPAGFRSFQMSYVSVYLIIMLSDWLQGTHMWTLYNEYKSDPNSDVPEDGISTLFITGFAASGICSTFIGPFVDKWGRKKAVLLYCFLELVINTMEHFDNMTVLLMGRVIGGLTTALLFTAFESWMITEHHKKGFPKELISDTFGYMSFGNGLMGAIAGVIAQLLADEFGNIGPFQAAIALTALGMVIIAFAWEENTASSNAKDGEEGGEESGSFKEAWGQIFNGKDSSVLLVGCIQSLFEGGMYTFVFNWVPILMNSYSLGIGAFFGIQGVVFTLFMLCISIGGSMYPLLESYLGMNVGSASVLVYVVAAGAMAVLAVSGNCEWGKDKDACLFGENTFFVQLAALLVVEGCVGLFFVVVGTVRSQVLPSSALATLMNIFRVPLNILVVVGTKMSDSKDVADMSQKVGYHMVFVTCCVWFLMTAFCQITLNSRKPETVATKGGKAD